jgi:hypothetical protein
LNLEKGPFVVFDKAHNDYLQYLQWTQDDIYFVSRRKDNALYTSIEEFALSDTTSDAVLKDERIAYWDSYKQKVYSPELDVKLGLRPLINSGLLRRAKAQKKAF